MTTASSLTPISDFSHAPSTIHTRKLPTSKKTLDDALTDFETNISPWKTPSEYIDAEANYVNNIVHEIQDLTQRVEMEYASFDQTMIYSRLIAYILAHSMMCSSDQSLVKECIQSLQEWKTSDIVTKVQNYQVIKNFVQRLYRRLVNSRSRYNAHPQSTFRKLLTLDTITLSAHLTVIVTNDNEYKKLLSRRGQCAQSLLNLLQARLNIPIDPQYKSRHVKALIKLSKLSGIVPECLVLTGIEVHGDPVAGGGFGDVYKGKYQKQEIALKVLKVYQKSDMEKLLKDFSCEATTWRQLDHPNVLPFYGVFHLDRKPPRVCLASPWLENGNVVQYLAERAPNTDCVPLCLDIAQGLEYLHGAGIVHGDIKGLNILIAKSGRACLADFGLATSKDSRPIFMTYMTTQSTMGTVRWQAPELIPDMQGLDPDVIDRRNTMATDIYAYALVCHEMFSDQFPFHEITGDFQVMFAVKRGKRPSRPTHDLSRTRGLNDAIWQIIETCWDQDPDERYTASQVVESLRYLPDRPHDDRPLNDFDKALPPQVLSTRDRVDHPFFTFEQNDEDAEMEELKWISREI